VSADTVRVRPRRSRHMRVVSSVDGQGRLLQRISPSTTVRPALRPSRSATRIDAVCSGCTWRSGRARRAAAISGSGLTRVAVAWWRVAITQAKSTASCRRGRPSPRRRPNTPTCRRHFPHRQQPVDVLLAGTAGPVTAAIPARRTARVDPSPRSASNDERAHQPAPGRPRAQAVRPLNSAVPAVSSVTPRLSSVPLDADRRRRPGPPLVESTLRGRFRSGGSACPNSAPRTSAHAL